MKIEVGQKVKDTKEKYRGDIGTVEELENTSKGQYVTVQWGTNSKHGEGSFGRYKPSEFGFFSRFRNA